MLLWGPPFVGPKNLRFQYGFKKNLNKNLIFPFSSFYCENFEVYISKIVHAFENLSKLLKGPFVGSMFVS